VLSATYTPFTPPATEDCRFAVDDLFGTSRDASLLPERSRL